VARMTVNEQRIEGEFRYVNSRIITHCEEIAFYGGHSREELNIKESFTKLTNHYRNFIFFRFSMGFIDNIIAKCKRQSTRPMTMPCPVSAPLLVPKTWPHLSATLLSAGRSSAKMPSSRISHTMPVWR
jgi:ABC-type uncharacterized transport system fused permease/ATPase subunit